MDAKEKLEKARQQLDRVERASFESKNWTKELHDKRLAKARVEFQNALKERYG